MDHDSLPEESPGIVDPPAQESARSSVAPEATPGIADHEAQEAQECAHVETLLAAVRELLPRVAAGDKEMKVLLLQNFAELSEIPIPSVKKAMGIEPSREDFATEDAEKHVCRDRVTKMVLRCMDYTVLLDIDADVRGDAGRILLHTAVSSLLERLAPLVEQVLAKNFINLHKLIGICTELGDLCTDDIARILCTTDPNEISRLRVTLHDINGALCGVSGFADLYAGVTSKDRHAVRISEQMAVVRSMQHVLDEFFRPSAPKPHAMRELAASVEKSIRRMMCDRGITDFDVVVEIDEASFGDIYVLANRTDVLEIFKNFARNAYDARNEGTCVFKIKVYRDSHYGRRILIAAKNNGRPIPDDELSKLRDLCSFRIVNRSIAEGGTCIKEFGREWGTGLLGAATALENMGGSFVHIKSVSDDMSGAEFCICLPETLPLG